jgi:uncharacterized membrane protein YidH (DUF202 family)
MKIEAATGCSRAAACFWRYEHRLTGTRKQAPMTSLLTTGFYIALGAIVVVLGFGIANLARQDEKQASRSNQLMRLRVILQAVAIALLVIIGIAAGAIKFGG